MKMSIFFKKHTFVYASTVLLAFGQMACTKTTESTTTTATGTSDQAFDEYRTNVTTLETDVERGWDNATSDAEAQMSQWRTDYDANRTALAQYESDFDEDRRKEYQELQNRYTTAWNAREQQYNTWRQKNGIVSIDMTEMDKTRISSYTTARDIREGYEAFVKHVEANKNDYSNQDWKTVESYWNELDDRKNAMQSELSDKDKWEIGKAKTKYIAMKNASKLGNTGENIGSKAKDAGQSVGSSVKDAGKAIGNTAEKGAKKIGGAVKDVVD